MSLKLIRGYALKVAAAAAGLLLITTPVFGQQNTTISQGYLTKETEIMAGALVSLVPNSKNTVEYATPQRAERLIGVVDNNSLIALSSDTRQVQVATNGNAAALVSNINGDIKVGDKITASPSNGIGMKAVDSSQIVGTALADLSSVKTEGKILTDRYGDTQTIKVGLVPVQLNVGFYESSQDQKSFLPAFLQELANGVAGREVSAIRVVISLVILLIGLLTAGALLYAAVRSSLTAIGRNPLSGGSINKGLLQVGLISVVILVVALGSVYLILVL